MCQPCGDSKLQWKGLLKECHVGNHQNGDFSMHLYALVQLCYSWGNLPPNAQANMKLILPLWRKHLYSMGFNFHSRSLLGIACAVQNWTCSSKQKALWTGEMVLPDRFVCLSKIRVEDIFQSKCTFSVSLLNSPLATMERDGRTCNRKYFCLFSCKVLISFAIMLKLVEHSACCLSQQE